MNTRDFLHIVFYEAKLQSRGWLFRFFALFSLVFVVGCHAYWQGQGNCEHWRMVALPCSLPLMNAYLFSLVQSLFLMVMMSGLPSRLSGRGTMEGVYVRPVSNTVLFWGSVVGMWLLFFCQNLLVIVATVLLVHLTSLAEYSFGYYLFYLLTLNIPAWIIVAGFGVWTSHVSGSRVLSIALSVGWWLGCLFWLPYYFHGTFDYLSSGVPNLFSDLVGHVNLRLYLLHRGGWLFVGVALLFFNIRQMSRIPNVELTRRYSGWVGLFLLVAGVCSLCWVELDYEGTRSIRQELRASFERHWSPVTCRVGSHEITLEQRDDELQVCSDMRVYNPNESNLEHLVLFLNLGLRVTGVSSDGEGVSFLREGQVLLVERGLGAGDTLALRVEYSGKVDDRCCDLHLPDGEFEDVFHGDSFFPTGRRGAFVEDDFLLLTPASLWYPVALPPVNPLLPLATARDFTLFRLHVKGMRQGMLFSQGTRSIGPEGISFVCEKPLSGISLHGGKLKRKVFKTGDVFDFQFGLTDWSARFGRRFSKFKGEEVFAFLNRRTWFDSVSFSGIRGRAWYCHEDPHLDLLETPLSFYLSSHAGKREAGMVEPGMVFFHERGFDMDLVEVATTSKFRDTNELSDGCWRVYNVLFSGYREIPVSQPLTGFGRCYPWVNPGAGETLWRVGRNRIYSPEDPLAGALFDYLQDPEKSLPMGLCHRTVDFGWLFEKYDRLQGRDLREILSDNHLSHGDKDEIFELKLQEFWLSVGGYIPHGTFELMLDSLSRREGEIALSALSREWRACWGVDFSKILKEWEESTHERYYRTIDMKHYYDRNMGMHLVEGMVWNAGKTAGVVAVVTGKYLNREHAEFYSSYFAPGEVKKFRLITWEGNTYNKYIFPLHLGISANRPVYVNFPWIARDLSDLSEVESGCKWEKVSIGEFLAKLPKDEIVVDDSDPGFEIVDGNLTWLQRWLQKPPTPREMYVGNVHRWSPRFDSDAQGDSIRGFRQISGGRGKSTATWRVTLPEAGRYRVMGLAHKWSNSGGVGVLNGILYYYTVRGGEWEKNVEVPMDLYFPGKWGGRGWVDIGEFDFPAGEASVTLSDREAQGREDVTIVADAVKWVKLE